MKKNKVRKFAQVKRIIGPRDQRLGGGQADASKKVVESGAPHVHRMPSAMFFAHNRALGPPYHILVDTNFINKSIQSKLDVMEAAMDCLYAKCFLFVTECVIGEIEKLGSKFRLALRTAKNEKVFERLPCMHKGTYADDCILERVKQHPCFIVATNDKDLKCRVRKVPGIPIMYVARRGFAIERLPDAPSAFV